MTRIPDIEAVWLELQRLNVPMKGWWADPQNDHTGEPAYGMEVAPEALTDWEAEGLLFEWDEHHGWTMHDWCTPQIISQGVTVLDIPEPLEVSAVTEHLRRIVVGEITEFRTVVTR